MAGEREMTEGTVRVLYVIDRLFPEPLGGAERALWNMLQCLPRDRFRCSLVTFAGPDSTPTTEYAGYPVHVLRMRSAFDASGLRTAVQFFRYVRERRFDIVHTFFETSDLWAGPIARMAGCPVWVSSRRDLGILRSRLHYLAYPVVARGFDAVFAVSEEVRRFCIEKDSVRQERVQTIYTGIEAPCVDPDKCATLRSSLGLPAGAPVISTLANIRPIKGLDVLVAAAAQVCRVRPDAIFLIGGLILEREHFAALEQQVSALGLRQNVRFLGRVDAGTLLGISDVFCLLSRSEGFSNAILEAMACNLPVVATRVGGNAEAVLDGKTGFVVNSGDATAASDAIVNLITDPARRVQMGAAGRRRFEEVFTREAMTSHIMASYENLLVRRGRRQWRTR